MPEAPRLWLDLTPRPGWQQMALDSGLLAQAASRGTTVLRLYRWDPPCLSFGRHEPAARLYDRARVAALGLDAVRRPTGGRAVWHADEVTYALTAPAGAFGGLRAAYHDVHAMLAAALTSLGVDAALAPAPARAARPADGACFAVPAGGEVTVGGRKLVGSAQRREGSALLQHGSILLGGSQALVADVSVGAPVMVRATSLAEALGRRPEPVEVALAVGAAAERWRPGWQRLEEAPGLEALAAPFAARYRDAAWTWAR
ncbi:MAG: hypothetical protein MUC69_07145 [Gemmatimonadales bacterium]|nr:hypothetical protein [Gemmatimonadales bacterium]